MGICASREITRRGGGTMKWPPTAMVIDLDGKLQEFRQPIKTGQILSNNPNFFLCSSETMFPGSHAPPMPAAAELQLGQIYFLIPTSKSQTPLCLPDLCDLAIKASSALNNSLFLDKSRSVLRMNVRRIAELRQALTGWGWVSRRWRVAAGELSSLINKVERDDQVTKRGLLRSKSIA